MLKHARSFATLSICRPMSQLPIGTSLSVSTAGPIYPLSWTRISSKKPRPSPGGTACPCASSSRRGLDGRLLGELRFVEIRARLMMSRRGEHRKGYCNELPRACPVTNEASPVEYRVQRVGPESVWRRSFRPNDRTENQTAVNYVASI